MGEGELEEGLLDWKLELRKKTGKGDYHPIWLEVALIRIGLNCTISNCAV